MLKQKTTYRYLLWMILLFGVLKIQGQEPLLPFWVGIAFLGMVFYSSKKLNIP